jgi:hypothetical protein
LLTLCIDDVELALGSFKGRLRLAFAGTRFLVVGVGLFESLPGSEPIVAQRSVAVDVIFGAHPFSHCCGEVSPGLLEHRHTHAPRGVHIDESRPPCGNVCLSAGELRTIIAVVELEQQVASLDGLVIDNRDGLDKTRDLERQRRDLAPDIGVVGRFDVLPDRHPVPDETGCDTNEDGAGGEQQLTPRGRGYQVCDVVCRFAKRADVPSIEESQSGLPHALQTGKKGWPRSTWTPPLRHACGISPNLRTDCVKVPLRHQVGSNLVQMSAPRGPKNR